MASDSDESLVGGDGSAPTKSVSGRRTKGSCRTGCDLAGESLGCPVCEETAEETEGSKSYRGRRLHSQCFNALRCHARMLKTPAQKKAHSQKFTTDLRGWAEPILPLVATPGSARDAGQRDIAKELIRQTDTFTENSQIADRMWLTKRRYKTYVGFWDKVDSDDASIDFDEKLAEQATDREDEDGEPLLGVQDIQRDRQASGKRESNLKVTRAASSSARGQRSPARDGDGRRRPRDSPPAGDRLSEAGRSRKQPRPRDCLCCAARCSTRCDEHS